ncbi:hypothetical protein F4813DRAFT_390504 [Daldinia decipiens]|uniref:uncharacterized protein n=1 Tax=Daldinia decipiens TaxID=326647 RepID=UPI0020C3AF71|nr:uncharacterized protein F4813DRAFT_390504 [Daldinia decipiens]KAI1656798.1 hypothetical protein F4813DRAFT_390504 [Daldinia decipiens]
MEMDSNNLGVIVIGAGFSDILAVCKLRLLGFRDALTVPAEERDQFYRKRYLAGGWAFWMAGFRDLRRDPRANGDAYAFWAAQTRARISCTIKRELLVRRPCLEEDLYEVIDQPQLDIVDIIEKPIEVITETGICAHGKTIKFDVIISAAGFGDEASGLKRLNIRGRNGTRLVEAWSEDVQSHLGIAIHQFPNLFFLYGP